MTRRVPLLLLVALAAWLAAGCATHHGRAAPAPKLLGHPQFATSVSATGPVIAMLGPGNVPNPTVGEVLTTTNGTWTNTPTSYTYRWQDCDANAANCVNIAGSACTNSGTGCNYTITTLDAGDTIRVTVTATNQFGSARQRSDPTGSVAGGAGLGGTWDGAEETGISTTTCNQYASPTGNDSTGTGTIGAPYATVQKLSDSLTSGQVGCLRAGTYSGVATTTTFSHANVTITGYPGEAAFVASGQDCVSAAGITFSYLNWTPGDGSAHSFDIEASNTTFTHNNISEASTPVGDRGSAISVGRHACFASTALTGVTISYNRIHDYGNTGINDHGVYVASVSASSIYDNWIYDGSFGAGVQLFDGNGAEAGPHDIHIYSNIISGTLLGMFMYGENAAYKNNAVDHNVITDQVPSSSSGAGFEANSGSDSTTSFTTNDGFNNVGTWPCDLCDSVTLSGNITSNPQYADASYATSHDYRISPSSPVAGYGLWDGDYTPPSTPPPPPATACTKYASTSGNDSNAGTQAAPMRTVQALLNALTPGQAGCLTGGGTFVGDATFLHGGTAGSPVTLESDPNSSQATVNGVLYVPATQAYATIDSIHVDATNISQGVAVQLLGDHCRLINSDLYGANQDRNGVTVGFTGHTSVGTEISGNRIHNMGTSGIFEHGIYVDLADGVQIHDNYLYDNNGGYGIQLWTHSINGHIYNNTIDGNGGGSIIIAGQNNADGGPSSNNEIDHNILSNPVSGNNTTIFWSNYPTDSPGTGNTVHDNVYWNGTLDPGSSYCGGSCSGVTYTNNVNADPQYANRAAKNFTVTNGALTGYGVR